MSPEGWQSTFDLGRRAWPDIDLTEEAFSRFCTSKEGLVVSDEARASDLYLACACAAGAPQALLAFERAVMEPARSAVDRVRHDPAFVDEVLQQLRYRLFVADDPRILHYTGDGPLVTWVRVAAARLAIDLARASGREPLGRPDLAELVASPEVSPELRLLKETYRPSFQSALTAAIADLPVRDRNLLRMSVLDQLSIDEIAVPFGVHRATAARWLKAVKEQIAKAVLARIGAEHPDLTESDLSSLTRAVDSQLHLSLATLLRR
jgi:RNA polymerase sigma-70 factor, ECF subfamily